jgi:hypothetical protein
MLQVSIACFSIVLLGMLGLFLSLKVAELLTKKPVVVSRIFEGLRPKLWMTAGLGSFFSLLYIATLWLMAYLLDGERKSQLFELALHHPTDFIYGGLCLFITISLAILLVRSVIKRLYNASRGK